MCIGLWCWAMPRLFRLSWLRHRDARVDRSTDAWLSLLALGISAPVAYYLLWLLTTPPTIISAAGVTGGAGPPYYRPTTIHWSDVTSLRCTYIYWRRPRPRYGLSIQSPSNEIWIGRMSRFRAEQLLEVMQAHVPTGAVEACPEWSQFPWPGSTKW